MAKFIIIRNSLTGTDRACMIEAETMREARDKATNTFKTNLTNRRQTWIYVIHVASKKTVIVIQANVATLIKKEERNDREYKLWSAHNNLESLPLNTPIKINSIY